MSLLRVYEGAKGPSGGPTAGAKALMSWYLGAYGSRGGRNLGIYNPKRISGPSSAWSLHAEGRADDLGVPGGDPQWARDLAEALRASSAELGCQLVIYRRRVWSSLHPDEGWRNYDGSNPHTDHLHVELSRAAAGSLTVQRCTLVLGNGTGVGPLPVPPSSGSAEHQPGTRTLYDTTAPLMAGADVLYVQRFIGPRQCGPDDGVFGHHTAAGVRWYQRMRGVGVDGRVGPVTWGQMGVRWRG